MLKKEYIVLNMDCDDSESAIRELADVLVKGGAVRDSFPDAVSAREKEYPTGLPAAAFDVAVPHTTGNHVNVPSVAVGLLKHPVAFQQMGSPGIRLHPQVMLMLAINDPQQQLDLLKKIMVFLQDVSALQRLKESVDVDEAYAVLESYL